MQFLKKHYEKILLGVVLAGLIGVLVFMLFFIQADKQQMEDQRTVFINDPSAKQLPDLDLSAGSAVMARHGSPFVLDLETGNKVFNPFEWQKTPDGRLVPKATRVGAQVAVVTNITPLYLVLTLDSVMTNELGARYVVGVENQAAATAAKRRHQQHYVSAGDKPNDTFALVEAKGPPDNPDALLVKLLDTGKIDSFSRDKPLRRVDAYMVDFRYDLERKVFLHRRTGDKVSFGGTDYLVFDVKSNELILADQSNGKKTTLPFAP